MNYSELHEDKKRGTFDFPIELYYVEPGRAPVPNAPALALGI